MKIEAGKYYKMRCGGVVGPMKEVEDRFSFSYSGERWYPSGVFYVGKKTIFDLIEEVPDPSLTFITQEAKPDHFPDAGKMVFDRDAFRRETAVKVFLHLCQKMHPEETWGDVAECAVNAADALIEELGE